MSLSAEIRPSHGVPYFVVGGILVLIAIVGIVLYATGVPDLAPLDEPNPLRAVTIVGAAISGVLLLVLGVVKRVSAARRGR